MQDVVMAGFGASRVVVRGRARRGTALVLGILLPLFLGILCEVANRGDLQPYIGLLLAVESIGFLLMPAVVPNGIAFVDGIRSGPIRVDADGILFRGRRLVARAEIRNVAVEGTTDGGQLVHVSALQKRNDFVLELVDDAQARAFFDALDLDPSLHVATFSVEEDPLRSRARWLGARASMAAGALVLVLGVLALARKSEVLLLALPPVLLVYVLLLPRTRLRTDVVLGADGLTLRYRGRLQSIPLAELTYVRNDRNEATLVQRDGPELTLRFGRGEDERAAAQHAGFAQRMRRTLARRDDTKDPCEALLARGTKATATWARDLQALVQASGGYRVAAPVPDETLWRVAEGAFSEPTARVGALVALSPRLDEVARARLQKLAECTAQAPLKAALEAAANGEEGDAILAVYERLSDRA